MNTFQHSASPWITPLLALWHWLMARPGSKPRTDQTGAHPHATPRFHPTPVNARRTDQTQTAVRTALAATASARHLAPTHIARAARPLRVLQVVEAGQGPCHGARLRISGRMADVCAELDRLAAREAMQH